MRIIGAGMSGCLSGIIFPEATIFEKNKSPPINHHAVLRFRDDSISKITGIPFKKVTVHKGIWGYGQFNNPDIRLSNMYSMKVIKNISDRSIWNIGASTRFIAPADFQQQLYNIVKNRVILDSEFKDEKEITISTIPIINLTSIINVHIPFYTGFRKIYVTKCKIASCDTYQTIYFPTNETFVYRATITGDNLIIESTDELEKSDMEYIMVAFNLDINMIFDIKDSNTNQFGKIAEVDDADRKNLLYRITRYHNIYSVGRYAIWKNILMDDVLKDLKVIKQMIASSDYDKSRIMI